MIPLPNGPVAERLRQGLALLDRGQAEAARADLEAVTRLLPEFAPGWDALGQALASAGDIDAAERCFRRAARADQGSWAPRFHWAKALHDAGRPAEALRVLDRLPRAAADRRAIAYLRGRCALDCDRLADARRDLEAALAAKEDAVSDVDVLLALAETAVEQGDLAAAEQAIQRACLLRPNDAAVHLAWARIEARQGDLDAARRLAERAEALDRGTTALHLLVDLAMEARDWPRAERWIDALEARTPQGRMAPARRALLERRRGNATEARRWAKEALRRGDARFDAGAEVALTVLREQRASLQRCQTFDLVLAGLREGRAFFRAYTVLARDEPGAIRLAHEVEAALTPGPWRVTEIERAAEETEALEGVYWLSLRPAALDPRELEFHQPARADAELG